MKLLLIAAAAVALPEPALAVHPFHVSVAEVEYNTETRKLEIALRMYGVDIERALSKLAGKPCDLDDEKSRDKLLPQYLAKRFTTESATPGPKGTRSTGRMSYVGSELSGADLWAYFELTVPDGGRRFVLRNAVLTGVQPEQLNVVSLRSPAGRQTLFFNRKQLTRVTSVVEGVKQPAPARHRAAVEPGNNH